MLVTVLGSTAGTPVCGNPASGYLVEHADTRILVDAGSGTFMALCDRLGRDGRTPRDVDAVVISHIHSDHCADLFAIYSWFGYGPSGEIPVPVFVPEGAADHLAAFVRAGADHLFFMVFDFRTVGEGDRAAIGEVGLRFAAADHSVPALGVRLEAAGRSLTYSGDTGPGGGVGALAAGCDVFLCEATFQGLASERGYPYHLTAEEAGRIAGEAGVGRLVLTHVGSTLATQRSIAEAAAAFGRPVELATPGLDIDV